MSVGVKIEVEKDTASSWLTKLQGNITAHRIGAKVGPAATELIQQHFTRLNGNKRGWPPTGFYSQAARATNWEWGNGCVYVGANSPIGLRQRLMGGDIRPVKAGALTIPATEEAYGKRAKDFSNLQFKFVLDPELGTMRAALVEKQGAEHTRKGRKKKDGSQVTTVVSQSTGLVALFWLAKGVRQKPDPNVLPSEEEFIAMLDRCVEELAPK